MQYDEEVAVGLEVTAQNIRKVRKKSRKKGSTAESKTDDDSDNNSDSSSSSDAKVSRRDMCMFNVNRQIDIHHDLTIWSRVYFTGSKTHNNSKEQVSSNRQ